MFTLRNAYLPVWLVWLSCFAPIVHGDTGIIQNPDNGHLYQRFDTVMTWHEAKAFCETKGGYLATITSQTEQNFVYNNFGITSQADAVWLGGSDETMEGEWKWITGEPWSFTNWSPGEPNNSEGAEHFLLMWDPQSGAGGYWNDGLDRGTGNQSTICEVSSDSFSSFTPRAEFTLGPKANDDSYWVRGWLKLANTSNGINPLTEAVTIKVGTFSHTVPAGSFRQEGASYLFKGPVGPSTLDVRITGSSIPGGYSFKSCLKKGNLGATTMDPQVQLSIGDDQGQATLDVGYAKFGKGADGQKWVFPPGS